MILIPPSKHAGPTMKTGSQFTGDVFAYMTMGPTDGVTINTVNFTPCARTYWHSHERGQILIVLAGRGLVQADGGPVRVMRAGDTIWAPPGERHWHGAAPDAFVAHTAISLGLTTWAGPVSEDQYNSVPIIGEP